MCVSVAAATLFSTAASTAVGLYSARSQRKEAKRQEAALAQTEARAVQSGNAATAARRAAMRKNSLSTGAGALADTGMSSSGRATLGGP